MNSNFISSTSSRSFWGFFSFQQTEGSRRRCDVLGFWLYVPDEGMWLSGQAQTWSGGVIIPLCHRCISLKYLRFLNSQHPHSCVCLRPNKDTAAAGVSAIKKKKTRRKNACSDQTEWHQFIIYIYIFNSQLRIKCNHGLTLNLNKSYFLEFNFRHFLWQTTELDTYRGSSVHDVLDLRRFVRTSLSPINLRKSCSILPMYGIQILHGK